MKNYWKKENIKIFIILIIQLLMFYIFPMTAGPTDAMGMVIIIIGATFLLSFIMGVISNKKVKYLYPIICALIFIPSVFIYYNDSALIHSFGYLVVSSVGLVIGRLPNIVKYCRRHKWNTNIIVLILVIVIVLGFISYKIIASSKMKEKTYNYLEILGYTKENVNNIEISHSFFNKLLSYNEWRIFVEMKAEPNIIFGLTYRNNEIMLDGIKDDKKQITKEEIIDYESRFKNGELKNNYFTK